MSVRGLRETPEHHEKPDQWHSHASLEGAPQTEHGAHVSYAGLFISGTLMVAAVVATVVLLTVYFQSYKAALHREAAETTDWAQEALDFRNAELEQLAGGEPGVAMPIDEAMDAVVAEYGEGDAD